MKILIRAAFMILSLTVGIPPVANATMFGAPQNTYHSGPYDNTGNGPKYSWGGGGGG
jgi:hypothetical protein